MGWYYIDLFQDYKNFNDNVDKILKFIPDGQDDAAKIVMENGKFFQIWKDLSLQMYADEYHDQTKLLQTDIGLPCLSCPTKGDCSTIEVILDGDVKKKFDFFSGKYKKTTDLYDGKCIWAQIENCDCTLRYYGGENVWAFERRYRYGAMSDRFLRTVQDVPCPTVANIFEYKSVRTGDWKPAPINSVIIKCSE